MSIQHLPINSDNFLRFYPTTTPSITDSKYYGGLVNGYQYRWRQFRTPLPLIAGDTLHFYTNFETNIFDENTQEFLLVETYCATTTSVNDTYTTEILVDELGNPIVDELGNLINVVVDIARDTNNYQVSSEAIGLENNLITITIPLTNNRPNREVRLAIVETETNAISFISNPFKVLARTERNVNNTHIISFNHNTNIYNYEWQALGDLYPDYTVRVPSSILEFSYPKEDAVYKSATSGKPRKTRTTLSKAYQFETYYLDEDGHDAVNLAVNLDKFLINGDEFIADGAYEVDFQQLTNIHKGSINLLLKRYGARINNCVTIST